MRPDQSGVRALRKERAVHFAQLACLLRTLRKHESDTCTIQKSPQPCSTGGNQNQNQNAGEHLSSTRRSMGLAFLPAPRCSHSPRPVQQALTTSPDVVSHTTSPLRLAPRFRHSTLSTSSKSAGGFHTATAKRLQLCVLNKFPSHRR